MRMEALLSAASADYYAGNYTSIRAAATAYGLIHTTLMRRMGGTSKARPNAHENQQLLSKTQEDCLVDWILTCEACNMPLSHAQTRKMASLLSTTAGGSPIIGINWLTRFLQRHPILSTKLAIRIDNLRIQGTTPMIIHEHLERYKVLRDRWNIRAEDTYNMDETGLNLGVCGNQYHIGKSSTKKALKRTPENREWVTIIETVSAAGILLQPLVIFKGKRLQNTWFGDDILPDFRYTTAPNGFTTNDIGLRWFEQIFLPQTAAVGRKRLLIMDGHASHVSEEVMLKAHQNSVYILYLPPHSSHVTQPLDVCGFSPVKTRYRKEIEAISHLDDSAPVKKNRFIHTYAKARQEGLTRLTILAGWRGAGLVPYCPRKVLDSKQVRCVTPLSNTPPTRLPNTHKRRRSNSITTPHNRRELQALGSRFSQGFESPRTVRRLFTKVGKGMDELHCREASNTRKIEALNYQLAARSTYKARKIAIDSNEAFASIQELQATREEATATQAAWEAKLGGNEAKKASKAAEERAYKAHLLEFQLERPIE